MFEQVVAEESPPGPSYEDAALGIGLPTHTLTPRIDVSHTSDRDWYIPDGRVFPGYGKPVEEFDVDELWERRCQPDYQDWVRTVRLLHQLEPEQYCDRNAAGRHNFRERHPDGLQIIFKLANIHLIPEKPTYDGGTWHIEGELNERICATVLYYYGQDNITDSYLAFRHQLCFEDLQDHLYENEYSSFIKFLSIENEGLGVQNLGKVLTRAGRMLAFPNIVQHQVQPFSLADKTKPGHRKILAMFLVDPDIQVLSTSVVPPQRRDWWADEVRKVPPFSQLPAEVFDMHIEQVDEFPVKWKDALKIREELIEEQSAVVDQTNAHWEQVSHPDIHACAAVLYCCGICARTLALITTPYLQEMCSFCEH